MRAQIIYNPISGKQTFKHHVKKIVTFLTQKGYDVMITPSEYPKHTITLAEEAGNNHVNLLVVSGGDGTLNEAVNGIMKSTYQPKLAYIPSGTTNDLGSVFKLPKNIGKWMRFFDDAVSVKMDITKINDHYSVYIAAAGLFTKISYEVHPRFKVKYGKLAYIFQGVKDIVNIYHMPMKIKTDSNSFEGNYSLCLISNIPHVGGFYLRRIRPSKLNDGLIEMNLFERQPRNTLFRVLSFFLMGERRIKGIYHTRSSAYQIHCLDDVVWNIDGERAFTGSVTIQSEKEALEIFVPKRIKKRYFY